MMLSRPQLLGAKTGLARAEGRLDAVGTERSVIENPTRAHTDEYLEEETELTQQRGEKHNGFQRLL